MNRVTFFVLGTLLTAMFLLLVMFAAASAQGRTYYGPDGKAIIRETTDSQGTTTRYGADGRAMTRESRTRHGNTLYDAQTGKPIAKSTQPRY